MILPDVNLLLYAYNSDARHHPAARGWWEQLLSGDEIVGLPWAVGLGFVRLMTHPAVLQAPLAPGVAIRHVRSWLERPNLIVIEPGPRHLDVMESLLEDLGIGGNLTTDAHLASLAIEHQAELHSNDTDFGRFSGLRWRNPLE